ncbi:MAG: endonuclease/exonuclease/phosphatase family protein [Galbitalea sp.]
MIRKILATIIVLVIALVLLVAVWPQLFGLQSAPIVAQVVSLRGLDVAIALVVAVGVGLLAIAWRGARRFLGTLVVLLLAFCLASFGILASRGFGGTTAASRPPSTITVLSWNTKGDAPGTAKIAKLALADHADVIALPETTQRTGFDLALMLKAAGRPMWVYSAAHGYTYESHATTLLISAALGEYSVDVSHGDTSVLSSIIAKPHDPAEPTIVAVHAVSPQPQEMLNWRADLRFLSTVCSGRNLIMAGDFNSTLDALDSLSTRPGADFGGCTDSGRAVGAAAVGTWPTTLPALLGAQIDHVMYTSPWRVAGMRVIQSEDGAGSDHRPILATLSDQR